MINMIRKIMIILISIFLSSAAFAEDQPPQEEKFISIADIHFDPFVDCHNSLQTCSLIKKLQTEPYQNWTAVFEKSNNRRVAKTGQDTNYLLFKKVLSELKEVKEEVHPQYVVILGDFLGHNFRDRYRQFSGDRSKEGYQAFVKKTLQFLTYKLNQVFPDIDIYPAVGNNDSYTGDYSVIPQGSFLKDISSVWSAFIKNPENKESFQNNFSNAGFYSVQVPGNDDLKIIMLDTVLFSENNSGKVSKPAAKQQLKWLADQLKQAHQENQKVMIGFHIPEGIDIYAVLKEKFGIVWKFWRPAYRKEFDAILGQYPDVVTAVFPAHVHRDVFQFLMLGTFSKIPVYITSSISPVFGNTPSFKIFTYYYDANNPNSLHDIESTTVEIE
jgi:sphingomyelin phosphodiesterase acid-like 3